ncbi:hypothetical protein [Enterobacter kobei]|uniref:hypothetical protein n=1 Tax=Enterobacter kobei TaxID=208224 RepID=UPI003D6EC15C
MPSLTFSSKYIGFQDYQPDPEDLCSLCGGNFGKAAMIEGKDKIHICMDCVDLLGVMKKERDGKKRDEAVTALHDEYFSHAPIDKVRDVLYALYDAIAAGKIPHIRID